MSKSNEITSTKLVKKSRKDGPLISNLYSEKAGAARAAVDSGWGLPLYDLADEYEKKTVFDLNALEPEKQLEHLKGEINIRTSITAQEVFKIGELLERAKGICQQEGIGYNAWIEDNFDFSYETSINYRNVFKNCFGQRLLAVQLPVSILYKISAPNFPDQLREELFKRGILKEISNEKIGALVDKYKEQGMEAVEDDINKFSKVGRMDRQIKYTLDQYENCLRTLKQSQTRMEKGDRTGPNWGFDNKVEGYEEETREIEQTLYDALTQAYQIMHEAGEEAIELRNQYVEDLSVDDQKEEVEEM